MQDTCSVLAADSPIAGLVRLVPDGCDCHCLRWILSFREVEQTKGCIWYGWMRTTDCRQTLVCSAPERVNRLTNDMKSKREQHLKKWEVDMQDNEAAASASKHEEEVCDG